MTNIEVYDYYKAQVTSNRNMGRYTEATKNNYSYYLDKFIKIMDSFNKDVVKASRKDIMGVVEELNMPPVSNNLLLSAIFNFYSILMESYKFTDEIETNPTVGIHRSKTVAHVKKPLEEREIEAMLDCMKDNVKLSAIFTMFVTTGLRVEELIGLTLSDYKNKDSRNCILVKGKGNKTRIVFLNKACCDAVDTYLLVRKDSDLDNLFIGSKGKKMNKNSLNNTWKRIAEKAGVENVDMCNHNLRKTFATNILNAGTDIMAVSRALGHSSVKTTQIYAEFTTKNYLDAIGAC